MMLARPESATARELRAAWLARRAVVLSLSDRCEPRRLEGLAKAIGRLTRALALRLSEDDPSGLGLLAQLEADLAAAWREAIVGMRGSSFSDADIGAALGVSKQAVQQRWPRPST
jgi:hypothetical protein